MTMIYTNKKIFIVGLVIMIGVLLLYNNFKKQNTIDQKISRYIQNNCADISTCKINISDFTDFDWDTVCFVDSGAALDSNPEIIPAPLPKNYSFNNPKIVFLEKSNIALFEEVPINIENIPSGTVLFESNGCFDRKQSSFSVKKIDNGLKGIYNLYQ